MQTPPGQGAPQYPSVPQYQPPPPRQSGGGMPAWVIVLIVVAVVLFFVAPVVAVVAGFAIVANVVEDLAPLVQDQVRQADERAVRDGVTAIQAGVEAWAIEHEGRYPAAARVDSSGLVSAAGLPLVDPWPSNPYAGGAMTRGTGPGQYVYVRGPGGRSYTLTGHGPGGVLLVTLP